MAIDRPLFSVFPTCVGVILLIQKHKLTIGSIPHMRGGDSKQLQALAKRELYSPHAWG